jgi:predicted lipid-binding transport protein (Tim44 family)
MISFGVLLVILGAGSLVLPYLNLQFTLMELVEPYQPWAGIIVAALGLITVLFGAQRRGRREAVEALAAAAPAASAPAESAPTESVPAAEPAAAVAPAATASTSSAADRAGEPTIPVSTTPPEPTQPASDPWPTEPPERSDD